MHKIYLDIKQELKPITILFKNILFSKETGYFHRAIHRCWYTTFIISFIVIIIDSITNGFYIKALNEIKSIHSDLRITFDKSISENKINENIQKIKKNLKNSEIENIFYYGMHSGFILLNKTVIPVIILTGNDFVKRYFLYKNFKYSLKGNKVVCGKELIKKNGINLGEKAELISFVKFNKNVETIKYKRLPIKIEESLETDFYDIDEKIVIIDNNALQNIIEKPLFNNININFKNKKNIESFKNELLKHYDFVATAEESFPSLSKSLALEKACSNIICILLLFMSGFSLYNLIMIFFLGKKKELSFYKIIGISNEKIIILCFFIAFFTIIFFSLIGGLGGYITSYLLNYFKIIKIFQLNEYLYIPFIPQIKNIFYTSLYYGFISLIVIYKFQRSLSRKKIYHNIA